MQSVLVVQGQLFVQSPLRVKSAQLLHIVLNNLIFVWWFAQFSMHDMLYTIWFLQFTFAILGLHQEMVKCYVVLLDLFPAICFLHFI